VPNIIDSLFLELGIDTSKFSADQKRALTKIAEFESQSKKAAKGARNAIKTVGEAFRDIADDSRVGVGAHRLDNLALKLRNLGKSAQVAGGVGTPLGAMVGGLGALLSPAALGVAAIGLLGKATWDLNEKMTATNATIYRNARLANISGKAMWAWGEAARTVGGNPAAVQSGIAGLQTSILGGMIGAGMPTSQLIGLARLGVKWNARTGVDIKSLFERVHDMGKAQGWARTWALVSSYGLMNQDEFNLAMTKGGGAAAVAYARRAAPQNFNDILRRSLESQSLLGKMDIQKAALAERAYGGIQKPMQTLVGLITNLLAVTNTLLGWTIKIAGWVGGIAERFGIKPIAEAAGAIEKWLLGKSPSALEGGVPVSGKLPTDFNTRQAMAMQVLMARGLSRNDAAAVVGNLSQESSLRPTVTNDNGAHMGLGQWDKTRQAVFAKVFGYRMGSDKVPERKQFLDEVLFARMELATSHRAAMAKMAAAADLLSKTRAFQDFDEMPGANDTSFGRRLLYAEQAYENGYAYAQAMAAYNRRHGVINRNVTNHTKIGDVHVHTPTTDPVSHAAAVRKGISSQPLLDPTAQNTVALASRGMAG
jgi:hypothetical protein